MKRIFSVFMIFFLAGCNSYDDGNIPEIRYGQDICSECRMTLMDSRFSCVLLTEENEILKFDDIGCMALYESKNQVKAKRTWVHDAETQNWVDKFKAYYVFDRKMETPMGSHILALSSETALKAYLEKNDAKQVRFDQIYELLPMNNQPFQKEEK